MRKIYLFLIIIIIFVLSSVPTFAYSFAEYPIIPSEDRYDYSFIRWNPFIERNEFITTQRKIYYSDVSGLGYLVPDSYDIPYKIYRLENDNWIQNLDENPYDLDMDLSIGFEFLCSNYNHYWDTGWFDANSNIPATNWQQLQFQEQKSINDKLIDFEKANIDNYNLLMSIYTFLAFAITVSAGGIVIYILCKPIFYFLR